MNRAQRRQKNKEVMKYPNMPQQQIQRIVKSEMKKEMADMQKEMLAEAMSILLTIPMEVLMDHFWPKSYRTKIPKFTSLVIEYFDKLQNGELDIEEMKKDLWEYGGVRLEPGLKEE